MKLLFTSSLFLMLNLVTHAQNSFANTLNYSDSVGSPEATLDQLSWITGHWEGEAFGGNTEEIWSPASGGSMMCAFKLVMDGKVKFYEMVTITEENNTLILRLKHFHNDLTGWEAKDETVDFKLVKVTPNKVFFDGFTFEKVSDDEMNIYVIIGSKGQKKEAKFPYTKTEL